MSDLQYISIDPRAYFFIRESAIRNVYDAFTELITNSIDAYNKGEFTHKPVNIHIDYKSNILNVVDNAIGLSGTDMERCFMQVGAYTSTDESRGIFSRGAKDVSALGDVTYTSIKDGKISQVIITSVGKTGMLLKDSDVTEFHRVKYDIPENGMHVRIYIKSYIYKPEYNEICETLKQNSHLRDILSSEDTTITVKFVEDDVVSESIIKYEYPVNKTQLINMKYFVPGYDNIVATFELYMVDEKQKDYSDDNLNDYGVLLTDSSSIYENSLLHSNFRNNPYMQRLYGRIRCDYIKQLMLDIETNHSSKNPHPIIDPSRLNGLSRKHPFTKNLMSIPIKRLIVVLDDIETSLTNEDAIPDLNDIMDELKALGDDIFNELDITTHVKTEHKNAMYTAVDSVSKYIIEEEALPYSNEEIKKKYDQIQNSEEINVSPSLNVKFSNEYMPNRYLMYNKGPVFVIMISLQNPIVSQLISYDEVTKVYTGFEKRETRLLLSDILLEAFTNKIVETKLLKQDENMDLYYRYKKMYYEIYDTIDEKITHTLLKLKSLP